MEDRKMADIQKMIEEVKGMTEEDCEIELSYMSEAQDI